MKQKTLSFLLAFAVMFTLVLIPAGFVNAAGGGTYDLVNYVGKNNSTITEEDHENDDGVTVAYAKFEGAQKVILTDVDGGDGGQYIVTFQAAPQKDLVPEFKVLVNDVQQTTFTLDAGLGWFMFSDASFEVTLAPGMNKVEIDKVTDTQIVHFTPLTFTPAGSAATPGATTPGATTPGTTNSGNSKTGDSSNMVFIGIAVAVLSSVVLLRKKIVD